MRRYSAMYGVREQRSMHGLTDHLPVRSHRNGHSLQWKVRHGFERLRRNLYLRGVQWIDPRLRQQQVRLHAQNDGASVHQWTELRHGSGWLRESYFVRDVQRFDSRL